MARTQASLPEGIRITDHISLGVITKTFPMQRVRSVLAATGKASERERDLPAHVVVYYTT
ncbi:transposase domain-containing protein, partial [Alcaligenaceae bacterium CGII-47]|nr:transposase domain-containing protein [Alcaligenaceae bacterium CGII-47]